MRTTSFANEEIAPSDSVASFSHYAESDDHCNRPNIPWLSATCIVIAALCFLPRLSALFSANEVLAGNSKLNASPFITKPIEEIRPGDRVLARNPEVSTEKRTKAVKIDPINWRLIEMLLTGEDGHQVNVRLLRPLEWINHHQAETGGEIELELNELGISGYAGILNVSPCPHIDRGTGQVVTGSFQHIADDLVEVYVAGDEEPIVGTSGHPFWSEDRGQFVSASRLREGEKLRTAKNNYATVERVVVRESSASVFNIEVNTEHVYFVGKSGILVHNANSGTCSESGETFDAHPDVRQVRDLNDIETINGLDVMDIRMPLMEVDAGIRPPRQNNKGGNFNNNGSVLPTEAPSQPSGKTPVYQEFSISRSQESDLGGQRIVHDVANNRFFSLKISICHQTKSYSPKS